MRSAAAVLVVVAGSLAGCGGCKKTDPDATAPTDSASTNAAVTAAPAPLATMVAETLPRCRLAEPHARLALPGVDVVVGEAVVTADAVFVGIVRREGTKRLASVVRASLDLSHLDLFELGAARGDDPPPTPRLRGMNAMVTSFARKSGADAGEGSATRRLEIARIDGKTLVVEGSITQQADESLAYDVAWPEGAGKAGLVAWDEDAPVLPGQLLVDRGIVKVQLLGNGTTARIASPDRSDADAPRLLARPGGYWLAWLARRSEAIEDAGPEGSAETSGERRAYRWVELVALDDKGEATSPVRRVSSEKGHIASFDLVRAAGSAPGAVMVLAQDETAHVEGAGERIVRFVVDGEKVDATDVLDGGVGHALADLVPPSSVLVASDGGAGRFLSFLDVQEHAHLLPLGVALTGAGPISAEPSLDGVRVLGATLDRLPGEYAAAPATLFAVAAPSTGDGVGAGTAVSELRRFTCR